MHTHSTQRWTAHRHWLAPCLMLVGCPAAEATHDASIYYARVGAVLDDDSTVWCGTEASGPNGGHIEASFTRVPSDADQAPTERYMFAAGLLRARARCSQFEGGKGETALVTSEDSRDASKDTVSVDCPDRLPFSNSVECQIEAASPYVYLPKQPDDQDVEHADGAACIASITRAEPHSQVTGFVRDWLPPAGYTSTKPPLGNEALMRAASVGGTDEGSPFLARGRLHFLFGDTTDVETDAPLSEFVRANVFPRSNVLAITRDFDAQDGLRFDAFERRPGDAYAVEVVPSPHQKLIRFDGSEYTAIPLAGFGITSEAGDHYRFAWYVSVHDWGGAELVGFAANYSGLSYSRNGDPNWTRLDPPMGAIADFGPGAIWYDRYHRWLYFFGIKPPHGSVRLARVRTSFAKITDPASYEYWDGASWVSGEVEAAVALISETDSLSPRSEISVAFNAAAHVWTMMLLNVALPATAPNPGQIELWQAPAVTGPWRKVDADRELPNGQQILSYGPMMSEHLMRDAGLEVPFLLSQTSPIYNVHLWRYAVNLAQGTEADSCPH